MRIGPGRQRASEVLRNCVRTTELVRFFGSNSVHSLAARGVASTPREMRRLCLFQKTYAALLGTHRVEYGTSNLVQTKKLCPRTPHSKITERRLTPSPFLFSHPPSPKEYVARRQSCMPIREKPASITHAHCASCTACPARNPPHYAASDTRALRVIPPRATARNQPH